MVRSHHQHSFRQLVAIACFSLLTLHSDGAHVYGQPQQLQGYDRNLETPSHEDTISLESLSDLADVGVSWDESDRDSSSNSLHPQTNLFSSSRDDDNLSPSSYLHTNGRPPPSSYIPERYIMVAPEENFLRELVLHSAASPETRGAHGLRRSLGISDYNMPDVFANRLELKLPSVDSRSDRDWGYQENSPLHVKPKRLYQHFPQELQKTQSYPHYARGDVSLTEPRMPAKKKWWGGGYHRPRAQMDRRASQSKHYDCLKSCIKEGKLHPIQCHTLC